jgi:hypothetical protein
MPTSFAFILNPLEMTGSSGPVEILPNYLFQKADLEQINILKKTWLKLPASLSWLSSHECDYDGVFSKPRKEPIKLAPQDWRYWIITHSGSTSEHKQRETFFVLECALSLLQNDLEMGPLFTSYMGNQYQWNPRSLYSYFLDYQGVQPATKITIEEVQQIGTAHTLLSDFFKKMHTITVYPKGKKIYGVNDYYQDNFQHIEHAIRQFVEIKALPRYSGSTIIGLFTILESLITHKPDLNISDSLRHQIKTKMPLLSKKFDRILDYKKHFSIADEKKLWASLYDFRSKIVHDGNEDIGKAKELRSMENVINFLKEAVKLMILFSLKEPQLVTDLKDC